MIWSDFENTCGEGLASSPAQRNQARKPSSEKVSLKQKGRGDWHCDRKDFRGTGSFSLLYLLSPSSHDTAYWDPYSEIWESEEGLGCGRATAPTCASPAVLVYVHGLLFPPSSPLFF